MKKILSLLALMMLCITGANAEKVIYAWPADAEQANSITLDEGVTVTITGNSGKNIQNGNKITIDGTEYTSMKVSNGAQNTLTLPKEAVGITFYSYVNKDAATDRAPYWKEVAGVEYTEETSGGRMTSYKDGANPDVRSFSFAKTKEITFTNAGEQLCYVMEVEYAEEGTEPVEPVAETKTIFLKPGEWSKDNARFAAWSWKGELGEWYDFVPTNDIEGLWGAQIPAANTGLIAVRMDPAITENRWNDETGGPVWNQTDDIDLANVPDQSVIAITGWGKSDFTINAPEPPVTEDIYTVVGAFYDVIGEDPAFFGKAWDASVTENDMTLGADGLWIKTYTDVELKSGSVQLKVIKNRKDWIPEGEGNNIAVAIEKHGKYDFVVTFNAETQEINATATLKEEIIVEPEYIYAVVGKGAIFQGEWNESEAPDQMTLDETTGLYTWSVKNAWLEPQTIEFKVIKKAVNVNEATKWFPAEDNVKFEIPEAGYWNIIVNFNAETEQIELFISMREKPVYADNNVYYWESPDGIANENGGKAVHNNATDEDNRVNYKNADYYTICLNGKADYSTHFITITLDNALKAGDQIAITAYRNKETAEKKSGALLKFNDNANTTLTIGDGLAFNNINTAEAVAAEFGAPNTFTATVPAEADGATTITLTRSSTGTNLFITKLEISREGGIVDDPVEPGYYLVGTMNDWKAKADFQFARNTEAGEDVEEYMINLDMEANAEFKVVGVDAEQNWTWYPAEGDNFSVEDAGNYTVYFRPAGNNVWAWNYAYAAKTVEPEGIIPDGTYYVMNADAGQVINAESKLDAKGTAITFTFDAATNTYAIAGAEFFNDLQWTIAEAVEGMSGYYTISTVKDNKTQFLSTGSTEESIGLTFKDAAGDDAIWILLEKAYWEDIVNSTYTVAGTKNLTGTENDWDIVETNQMVLNEKTGLYEKKFKKIAVDGENQPEFKVVQTNMEGVNTWYPSDDNWKITTDYCGGEGLYDITITFDPSDFKEIGVIADKRIVFPADALVYDFEAAADAGENPANKNGSAANGQAFYGWENAEKTDSKRQDYKGYEWAEGSVLPEECHVWRRSDRINGNVAGNGGLKCPSNKEMAIDGLKAGDKVIIVYDAENASDKEIVWAIGDGTSEGGPGVVRATATINGVEAVTGETTIASGAEIIVNSVTPADNGSGYFVFQVKKGMVIQQIAVIPAPEPVETDYYLVGNMNDWTVSKDYMLVPNNGAPETEEYMFTLDLTTTSEFKIVKKDGETLIWYPEGEGNNYGQNGEITEDANYTVYFRPNYDGGEDWYYNCIYLVSNKEYEPIIPAGTYYVADMANDPLHFITDDGKLMCDGVPFEVTFDETTGTYGVQSNSIIGHYPLTIEEDAVYGHNISTTQNGVKVYLTANAMGTGVTFGTEPYAWALLPKEYVESDILSYTVAGTADLTGTDWTFVDANKMTKNAETGLFEIKYEGIEVTNEAKPEFKVVTRQYDDGIVVEGTEVWYPENNWVITPDYLGAEGKYTITITFNTTTKEIGVSGVKTGEPTGINGIYAEKLNNATIYNLNGQRIQNAQKGLYIINGRKVVVK